MTNHSLGVNRVILAIDVTWRAIERFHASSAETREGWEHSDRLQFRAATSWDLVDPIPIRFFDQETAREELITARRCQTGVWVYTDGSVQPGACGAATIFENLNGPFGETHLLIILGPLQSSTNAEMAGLQLALDHLASRTDWHQVYIVSDS